MLSKKTAEQLSSTSCFANIAQWHRLHDESCINRYIIAYHHDAFRLVHTSQDFYNENWIHYYDNQDNLHYFVHQTEGSSHANAQGLIVTTIIMRKKNAALVPLFNRTPMYDLPILIMVGTLVRARVAPRMKPLGNMDNSKAKLHILEEGVKIVTCSRIHPFLTS